VPEEFIERWRDLQRDGRRPVRDPGAAAREWNAQRIRERVNDLRPRYGMHDYAVAARHDEHRELAALTEVAVDPADPGLGTSGNHGGDPGARGHRLGLLVKLAMMNCWRPTEPGLERSRRWNSESNGT